MNCQGQFFSTSSHVPSSNHEKEALKKELVARLLPKKELRAQTSKREINMKLRSKFKNQKKNFWLGKGFSLKEALFLAFQNLPKKTSVEDCSKLLELCDRREKSHTTSNLQSSTDPKQPRIVVAFVSQPHYTSFNKLIQEVQLAIREGVNKLPVGTPIKIVDSYTEGNLVLVCNNIETKKWLESIVPFLAVKDPDSGEDVKLLSCEVPVYPTNFVKIIAHIPCSKNDSLTIEGIFKTLSNQNPTLVTNDWKVPEFRAVRTGVKMIILVHVKYLEVMKRFNWTLAYNGQKAKFELEKHFRTLRFWNYIGPHPKNKSKTGLKTSRDGRTHSSQTRNREVVPIKQSKASWRGAAKNKSYPKSHQVNPLRGRQARSHQNKHQAPYIQSFANDFPRGSFQDDTINPCKGFQDEDRNAIPYYEGSSIEVSNGDFQGHNPRARFQTVDNAGASFWGNNSRSPRESFHESNFRNPRNTFQQSNYKDSGGHFHSSGFQNSRGGFGNNYKNSRSNVQEGGYGNQRENYLGGNFGSTHFGW